MARSDSEDACEDTSFRQVGAVQHTALEGLLASVRIRSQVVGASA
eukprot:CAMPEP_0170294602 /NCGR_PEP_ID=MMETSP0116_2-20130129/47416_1 /TAXON_ID=400756 /ORGANISM="Durinskia baltica, Strain CSIRO CS-38" /LENGTH=44 /DNA_ID= /DNA_START= /DNA_END= /DNA_ORIENTATION=